MMISAVIISLLTRCATECARDIESDVNFGRRQRDSSFSSRSLNAILDQNGSNLEDYEAG